MKIFLNKNTHVGTDEPADKTKTWLPQNLTEEVNFLSNPATYGVLSGPRVKIAEGLDAQNIDAYGEKFRVYEVEPSTLVVKEYKNGAWVNMELNLDVPEDDSIVGTWVFNDSIALESFPHFVVEFTNNGIDYVSMSVYDKDSATGHRHKYFYYHNADIETQVFYSGSDTWYDETYRTIVITSEPTDATFITWLKANATKQGAASLISFTIDGTSYEAEDGMTWAEFIDSEYNPDTNYDTSITSRKKRFALINNAVYYASDEYNSRPLITEEDSTGNVYSTDVVQPIEYDYYVAPGGSN